jgi:hypothetical protein
VRASEAIFWRSLWNEPGHRQVWMLSYDRNKWPAAVELPDLSAPDFEEQERRIGGASRHGHDQLVA